MIRLLHVADVHLGAPLGGFGGLAEERARAVLDAFRRLPEVAAREEVDAALFAGDLFDGPRPSDVVLAAVEEVVRRLEAAGIATFAVPGNHDAPSLGPGLYERAFREGATFLEPAFGPPVTVGSGEEALHVYGIAYDPAEEPDPLATYRRSEAEGFHVVLVHGAVQEAPHWTRGGSLRLPPERLAELDADYLALGDYHRFRPPDSFAGGAPACYPGSFAAVDLTETGPRGPAVVELEGGSPPRIRRLESGVPSVVRIDGLDVTSLPDEGAVVDAAAEALPDEAVPVVQLTGEPAFPLDAEAVRRRLAERYGCADVEDETRFYGSARLAELARRKTVAGHVARLGLAAAAEAGDESRRRVAEEGLRVALRALGVR